MADSRHDRREDSRMPVEWAGILRVDDDHDVPCTVHDISLAGVKVESAAELKIGAQLVLSIPSLGDFAGTVRWVRKPFMGIALQVGPDLLLKRVAENSDIYPNLMPKLGR